MCLFQRQEEESITRSFRDATLFAERFAVSTGKLIALSSAYGRPRWRPLIIMAQMTNLLNVW